MQPNAKPTEDANYRVHSERGPASLIDKIIPEWRALAVEGPCNEPFYDPAWVQAYVLSFEPNAPVTLLTVRQDGILRGVLPLVERSIGYGPFRLRMVRAAANSHFPRFDVIHGAGDGHAVAQVLWEHLRTTMRWDLLQFESAPSGSLVWYMLELAATAGHSTRHHRPDSSPYIDLTRFPAGIEAIIGSLSSNQRSSSRRALKRLRARGAVEFRVVGADDSAEAHAALHSLYQVEASGWKGEANTAIVSSPATEMFYNRIAANAVENGSLAIAQLWCDHELVGTKLNLVWGDTIYELKSGLDDRYRDCSPGHMLKAYTVQAGKDMGLSIFDNCGRSEPHKVAWTPLARPFATCFIGSKSVRARLTWTLLFRVGSKVRQRLDRMPIPTIFMRLLE